MLLFEYEVLSTLYESSKKNFRIAISDEAENNVTSWFHNKKYQYTISRNDIKRITEIIKRDSSVFAIPARLKPNNIPHKQEYSFFFSDGEQCNSFSGFDILDYGNKPRKNATLALRVSREIKEYVLEPNNIKTMIPRRLQNWPKYRRPSSTIKIWLVTLFRPRF